MLISRIFSLLVVILFTFNTVTWSAPMHDTLRAMSIKLKDTGDESSFGEDVRFLQDKLGPNEVIVLTNESGQARVAVVPRYQGRVMTSTASGDIGTSFGWINKRLIASGKTLPHMNPFGGEDRFWMGPEGGQFAIFFPEGASPDFNFADWQTPAVIDTEPFGIEHVSVPDSASGKINAVSFKRNAEIANYSGTKFKVQIGREIRLLDSREVRGALHMELPDGVKVVAYESNNMLTNTDNRTWFKENGLLSIWILGMYNPSPDTTVIIPFRQGEESELGPVVNDVYFGKVPSDRLVTKNGVHFFRGDGQQRGKIGVSPKRALPVMGSYDASTKTLTIVQYTKDDRNTRYVNSLWEIQNDPFAGDVANSYNDGAPEPGAAPLGPFYELESSSAVRELRPYESIQHTHRTMHMQGTEEELDTIARQVFGVSLEEIKTALPSQTIPELNANPVDYAAKLETIQTFLKNKGILCGLVSLENMHKPEAEAIINVIIEAQRRGALYVPEIALRGSTDDVNRALALISKIRKDNPDAIIAAGSVSSSENSRKAVE
ncbi:MAG: hypothetical protein JW946_04510, partial [Candidatus Omnitrophica bacterium]|nr:hypothetical protein [Candidatus Omnitrophota bacterium]